MTDVLSSTGKKVFISGYDSTHKSLSIFWKAEQKTPADHLYLVEHQRLPRQIYIRQAFLFLLVFFVRKPIRLPNCTHHKCSVNCQIFQLDFSWAGFITYQETWREVEVCPHFSDHEPLVIPFPNHIHKGTPEAVSRVTRKAGEVLSDQVLEPQQSYLISHGFVASWSTLNKYYY